MKRQGFQYTRKKVPYTNLSDNNKTNLVSCVTVDLSNSNEGKLYSDICGRFPIMYNKGNRYIYIMYVYDCN